MLRLRLVLLAAVLIVAAALVFVLQSDDPDPNVPVIPTPPGAERGEAVEDPFAYSEERAPDLTRRAARGTSRLLYTRSPGGAAETAKRVAGFREPVEAAAKAGRGEPGPARGARVPGERRPARRAGARRDRGRRGAHADPRGDGPEPARHGHRPRAQRLVHAPPGRGAARRATCARAAALTRARRRVDDRFDPAKALAGTARYLKLGLEEFEGREDLAFVSYHMGMGNLNNVIEAFGGGPRPYVELYFDSTPQRHRQPRSCSRRFGDDSSNYYWKLLAARDIMRAHRKDPAALDRTAEIRAADASGRGTTAGRRRAGRHAHVRGGAREHGTEALARPGAAPGGARGRALHGLRGPFGPRRRHAPGPERRRRRLELPGLPQLRVREQALAFQYVLDRLQVLDVIAWSRSERTIRVTAGP